MVERLSGVFASSIAFKGGYMLNKILPFSRMTQDVDFSLEEEKNYEKVKEVLASIAEEFKKAGIVSKYSIKETIAPRSSGGIDMYDDAGQKILGVDVGLHNISYGTRHYDIKFTEVNAFEIERMLSDKVIAILSRKRFRRSKDLYDLYAITSVFDVDFEKISKFIELRGGAEWDNIPFSDDVLVQYKRAWDRLEVIDSMRTDEYLEKPNFEEAINRLYAFTGSIKYKREVTTWDHKWLRWI
jgi:hypothetical protein